MHVLFVCTGNICRSPTAERLAIARAAELGVDRFSASSAGTRALVGHPIHPEAARVIEGFGARTAGFTARRLSARIAADADLILTMTRAHADAVLETAPRQMRRTFLLSEVARLVSMHDVGGIDDLAVLRPRSTPRDRTDVPDPIGRSSAVFDAVGAQIAELLDPVLAFLGRATRGA